MSEFFSTFKELLILFCVSIIVLCFFIFYNFIRKNQLKKRAINFGKKNIENSSLKNALHHSAFDSPNLSVFFLPNHNQSAREIYNKLKLMKEKNKNFINENYISIKDEIDLLVNFLEMQKNSLSGNFDYEIKTSEYLEIISIKIPAFLVFPLVANIAGKNIPSISFLKIEFITLFNNSLKIIITYSKSSKIIEFESDKNLTEVISILMSMFSFFESDDKFSIKRYSLDSLEKNNYGASIEITLSSRLIKHLTNTE